MSSLARVKDLEAQDLPAAPTLQLRCPRCRFGLGPLPSDSRDSRLQCPVCLLDVVCRDGIWRALPPAREAYFERFTMEYQAVRAKEGRGSGSDEYYLELPFRDATGKNEAQWWIRARTFRYLERRVLPLLKRGSRPIDVLDIGAGNGWLSYRLSMRGHRPVAVDLLINKEDGLGAAVHYANVLSGLFPRFQAEMDHLPFADSQFQAIIFNASLHYSEDYTRTIAESVRCLRNRGLIVIADTPWYSRDRSGQLMIAEKRDLFTMKFGFPSDGIASQEFLTDSRLLALEDRFALQWHVHSPWYGVRWALRPLIARVRGRREPSRFRIYVAEVRK